MAVAGGASPCLRVTLDKDLGILIIGHGENRLIRAQVPVLDEDGNVVLIEKGKNAGKPKTKLVPTGAAELDVEAAASKLRNGEAVWITARDRAKLADFMGLETCPKVMLSIWIGRSER